MEGRLFIGARRGGDSDSERERCEVPPPPPPPPAREIRAREVLSRVKRSSAPRVPHEIEREREREREREIEREREREREREIERERDVRFHPSPPSRAKF